MNLLFGTEEILKRAKKNAYMLLRMRPRSEKELRERLSIKGYTGRIVNRIIEGLKKSGEIDDAKFARFWVNSRAHMKPVGEVVLRNELRAKGVAEDVIESALTAENAGFDEYEIVKKIATEKLSRLRRVDSHKAAKRLYDFLTRRGFKFDIIRKIIEELKNEG